MFQTPQNLIQIQNETKEIQKELDCLIEMKCKQLSKSSFNSKCNAIHLEKWMKGELLEPPYVEPDEPDGVEEWTEEMVMNRSRELNLLDCQGNLVMAHGGETCRRSETRCEEYTVSEHSPSKSTTTESQVSWSVRWVWWDDLLLGFHKVTLSNCYLLLEGLHFIY